jgi:hypothetical protein
VSAAEQARGQSVGQAGAQAIRQAAGQEIGQAGAQASGMCRRCLLEELSREAYAGIRDYIQAIDEAQRAGEAEYRRRLAACKNCRYLSEGLCVLCGCFVEARAAKKLLGCPDTPGSW